MCQAQDGYFVNLTDAKRAPTIIFMYYYVKGKEKLNNWWWGIP